MSLFAVGLPTVRMSVTRDVQARANGIGLIVFVAFGLFALIF
ncbi:MAG: hypothetical protein ACR2RB_05135 [Gammaproteobacteria bacterium]